MLADMEFTTDWVSSRDSWWRRVFWSHVNRPLNMLEVGFFEGRSAQWWLSNLLTHPDSRLTCLDRWSSKSLDNRARLAADPLHGPKFSFHVTDALPWVAGMLARGEVEAFDVVYSDFSKEAADIMTLACMAFRLLKPGGIYLFDDYAWVWTEASLPFPAPKLGPKAGIDAWLTAHEPFIESVEMDRGQVAVVKKQLVDG